MVPEGKQRRWSEYSDLYVRPSQSPTDFDSTSSRVIWRILLIVEEATSKHSCARAMFPTSRISILTFNIIAHGYSYLKLLVFLLRNVRRGKLLGLEIEPTPSFDPIVSHLVLVSIKQLS